MHTAYYSAVDTWRNIGYVSLEEQKLLRGFAAAGISWRANTSDELLLKPGILLVPPVNWWANHNQIYALFPKSKRHLEKQM